MANRTTSGKAGKTAKGSAASRGRMRKVTYSLPEVLVERLDEWNAGSRDRGRQKSRVVAEALTFYFAEQDKQALRAIYAEAAEDPQFQKDNAAIESHFSALDNEVDELE